LIYRQTALVATYLINVVFPAIAKAEGSLLANATKSTGYLDVGFEGVDRT
jgi:hypothetical protein